MIYKIIPKLNEFDPQIYARIDDDGLCRLTCSEDYPEFQEWLSEGNVPLPADSVASTQEEDINAD
jgi:hypothetical protein